MKLLKKAFALCSGVLMSFSNGLEVNALFGNAHFNIGQKIIKNLETEIYESEKRAFLSGLVYADIGRFKFDEELKIESDSDEFVEEMKKHVQTSEEEWFVRGFEMHVLQDKETSKFLKNAFGFQKINYVNYAFGCGFLDAYFSDQNNKYIYNEFLDKFNFNQIYENKSFGEITKNIDSPKDFLELTINSLLESKYDFLDKVELVLYDDLIIKTYAALGLKINTEDLQEQAANIVGSFAVLSSVYKTLPEKTKFNKEDLASKIELECENLTNLCIYNLRGNNQV